MWSVRSGIVFVIFVTLFQINAFENGKSVRSSAYKTPGGDFILGQPENTNKIQDYHGAPPHFEELRTIHKIKDRVKREAILEERTNRSPRSPRPQFSANVGIDIDKNKETPQRDQKAASINFPRFSGGAKIDAPTLADVAGGLEVGGRVEGGHAGVGGRFNPAIAENVHLHHGKADGDIRGGAEVALPGVNGGDRHGASVAVTPRSPNVDLNFSGDLGLGHGAIPVIHRGPHVSGLESEVTVPSADVAGNHGVTAPTARLDGHVGLGGKADLNVAVGHPDFGVLIGTHENGPVPNLNPSLVPTSQPDDSKTIEVSSEAHGAEINLPHLKDSNHTRGTPTEPQQATTTVLSTVDKNEHEQEKLTENVATTTPTSLTENNTKTENTKPMTDYKVRAGELLLPPNYEILQIPKPDYGKSIGEYLPGPLICLLLIRILGISTIDEIGGSITFDADFTVSWIDGVIFDVSEAEGQPPPTAKEILRAERTLSPVFLKKLWRPDIYMEDLIKVDQPTITNKAVLSLKFNKLTGFISYTVRMTVTVNCPMSFEYYPADTQRCVFRLASYSHTKDDMTLDWLELDAKNIGVILEDDSEDNFDIKLDKIDKYDYTPKWNNVANSSYEVLTFSIAARRKLSYHLIQTYLPSVFNIFVTWLVFLIPYTLYDCRIGTTMTTLLTLTAMFSAVREQSPQVNYIKAIDLWMLACVLFIFLNLVELSVMTWMRVTIETFEEAAESKAEDIEAGKTSEKNLNLDLDKEVTPWKIQQLRKIYTFFSHRSFAIFATLFVFFNIVYWTWLFTASEYFDWVANAEKEL